MKKIFTYLMIGFLLIGCMLLLSKCGFSEEEKERMKEYEKIAEKNTINYIEEKYGYTPVIQKIKCESYQAEFDLGLTLTGSVFVLVYDENKEHEFWVYTTGEEETTQKCWDNCQYPEIEATISDELHTILGTEIEQIELGYGRFDNYIGDDIRKICSDTPVEKTYGLIHEYYDGTNLFEVLQNYRDNWMDICFISEQSILDILGHTAGEFGEEKKYTNELVMTDKLIQVFGSSVDFHFFNFRDRESYNYVHNIDSMREFSRSNMISEDDLYIYMTEKYDILSRYDGSNPSTEYNYFDLKEFNDFYYVAIGGTYCNFRIANEEMKPAIEYDSKQQKVYDAYYVDSDAAYVMVYIPINAVKIKKFTTHMLERSIERSSIYAVIQQYYVKADTSKKRSISNTPVTLIGKKPEQYFALRLNLHNFYEDTIFSIFYNKNND